ncbi:MAG: GTPase [Promethearchaeota archaeon]
MGKSNKSNNASKKRKIQFSYPRGNFPRLCLIGNSNVGKSSITRLLLSHPKWYKGKVGKTAGSTVRLTIINDPKLNYHVIDLPGFGRMVRLDRKSEEKVQDQILNYIELDKSNIFLMLIVVSADRLGPELEKWYFKNQSTIPLTLELVQFMKERKIPSVLVLNKVDKMNSFRLQQTKEKLFTALNELNLMPKSPSEVFNEDSEGLIDIIETSAKNQQGIKELKQLIYNFSSQLDLSLYDPRNRLQDLHPINQKK